jgi:hypothetical protein
MKAMPQFTGRCRFCGCTAAEDESQACNRAGGKCVWLDSSRTVCNAEPCVRRLGIEQAKARQTFRAMNRKRTPPEIEAIKREERKQRRKDSRERSKKKATAA